MLRRLLRLYQRYMIRHLCLSFGSDAVPLTLKAGRLYLGVAGALEHGGARAEGREPSLPYDPGQPVRVALQLDPAQPHVFPTPTPGRLLMAQVTLWPVMIRRALSVLPLLPRIADPGIRVMALRRLGMAVEDPAPSLRLSDVAGVPSDMCGAVDLLLPVHNAGDHVARCLERIPVTTDLPWRLVIIDDGSTDPGVVALLQTWVAQHSDASLIRHDLPKGFAGAINAGLGELGDIRHPVVLLNSDVTLPKGWASRLIAPLLEDGTVASVTPLSNEGEVMGAPHACAGVALRNGEVDAVDAALAPFARVRDLPMLPTGTGFCMALSPHWLQEVPHLDDSFGRGYGEEVDWCQRTRALGGRHLCQTGLFVGHVGAASFGRAARQVLREKSAPVLSKRWPRFDAEVALALAQDPLVGDRLRAGFLWARARLQGVPLPVYLAHSLGGGTARWLEQRLRRHEVAAVLRVGGALRWQLELHTPSGATRAATDRFEGVLQVIRLGGPRDVVYTCAVGDSAPEEIPFRLLDLCAGGHGLEVLFHDYFPLNRDYTLRSETDPDWQALWRPLLDRAAHLTVFSEASRRIVAGAHPDLAQKLRLRPHGPLGPVPQLTPALSKRPVIGVPGNLNAQKGAEVVAGLARVFAGTGEARIVVLGDVAPDCPLPRQVRVLGGYRLEDLPHLVARHQIGLWLIPSLWPETFSYVTHEALATGLPCIGFDLGGQGDALRGAENGQTVPLRNDGRPDLERLLAAFRELPGWPHSRSAQGGLMSRRPVLGWARG